MGGPDTGGHDELAASQEGQLDPGDFREGVCLGQVPGISSEAQCSVCERWSGEEGQGGWRGGRRRGGAVPGEEGILQERKGVMDEGTESEVRVGGGDLGEAAGVIREVCWTPSQDRQAKGILPFLETPLEAIMSPSP